MQNWQDKATEGMDVPNWGLEPIEGKDTGAESLPSFAETRVAEIAAEAKVVIPESPEKKAVDIEAIRAEIAGLAKKEEAAGPDSPATKLTNEQKISKVKRGFSVELLKNNIQDNAERDNIIFDLVKERGLDIKKDVMHNIVSVGTSTISLKDGGITEGKVFVTTEGKAITFFRANTGEKQVFMCAVVKNDNGSFSFAESLGIYGEEVENLWKDYQPDDLFTLYTDADKILDMEAKPVTRQEKIQEGAVGSPAEIISGLTLHHEGGSAYVNLWENNNDLSKFKAALNFLKENGGGSIDGVDVAVKVKRSSGEIEDDWFIKRYDKGTNSFLVMKKNGGGMNKIIPNLELVSQNA